MTIQLPTGVNRPLTATSIKNGEIVASTEQYPITYLWSSSDETIAIVDENGVITALAEGACEITCTLEQNPEKNTTISLEVVSVVPPSLEWVNAPPPELPIYDSYAVSVAYYENGIITPEIVAWDIQGAEGAYTAQIDDNTIILTCYSPSSVPLSVTASFRGISLSAEVKLVGL